MLSFSLIRDSLVQLYKLVDILAIQLSLVNTSQEVNDADLDVIVDNEISENLDFEEISAAGEETGQVRRSKRKRTPVVAGFERGTKKSVQSRRNKQKKSYKEDEVNDDNDYIE